MAGYNWRQAAENLEHRQIAVQMRAEGAKLTEIGEALGISRQAASGLIRRTIQRVEGDAVHEMRAVWNARYEADYHALDERAAKGDHDAINARSRIGAQVALLNGLNAPTKQEITGADGGVIQIFKHEAVAASIAARSADYHLPSGETEGS